MNIFINSNVSQREEINICDYNGYKFGFVDSSKTYIKSFNDLQQYVNNLNFDRFYEYPLRLEKTVYIGVSLNADKIEPGCWGEPDKIEMDKMRYHVCFSPRGFVVVRDKVSSLREVLDRMPAGEKHREWAESCYDYKKRMDCPAFFDVEGSDGWVDFAWKEFIFVDRDLHRIIVAPEPRNGKIIQRNTGKTPKILSDFFNPVKVKLK